MILSNDIAHPVSSVWYEHRPTGLREVAYRGLSSSLMVYMKSLPGSDPGVYLHMDHIFAPITILTEKPQESIAGSVDPYIHFRKNGDRIVIRYPLEVGVEWISFRHPWLQSRVITELIHTDDNPGGHPSAINMTIEEIFHVSHDTTLENSLTDRYSRYGLTYRHQLVEQIWTSENGTQRGTFIAEWEIRALAEGERH